MTGTGYLFIAQLSILIHGNDMVEKVKVPVVTTMLALSSMSDAERKTFG